MIIIAARAINCRTLPLSLLVSFFIYWLAALAYCLVLRMMMMVLLMAKAYHRSPQHARHS